MITTQYDALAAYLSQRGKMKFDTRGKNVVPFIAIHSVESDDPIFETDKSKTDTPTITLKTDPNWVKRGIITRILYRLNPTAAETYTLMVFEAAKANNYESNSRLLYESAAARVDDTDYVEEDAWIIFKLDTAGIFYIATDWTGAPGVTPGYIRIEGVAYA